MEVSKEIRHRLLYHCYACYVMSGAVILIFGALLPHLIEESNLNYAMAGALLSVLAVGNLFASFYYPLASRLFGYRNCILTVTLPVPFILLAFTMNPPVWLMYVMIFVIGMMRGANTLVNNQLVNQATDCSTKYLNILHTCFAVGAFLAPFIMSLLMLAGFGWRSILYLLAAASLVFPLGYGTADFSGIEQYRRNSAATGGTPQKAASKRSFLCDPCYLLMTAAMFFYVGLENVVNGWFVTYLKDAGIMSVSLATTMVSVVWVMIMIGRAAVAAIGNRFRKSGIIAAAMALQCVAVLLMVNAENAAAAALSIALLGLAMSCVYPTAMAAVGSMTDGSTMGISMMTAIIGVGGILITQLVGFLADVLGIAPAMSCLVLVVVASFVLSLVWWLREKSMKKV